MHIYTHINIVIKKKKNSKNQIEFKVHFHFISTRLKTVYIGFESMIVSTITRSEYRPDYHLLFGFGQRFFIC